MLAQSISNNSLILGAFALVTVGFVAGIQISTKDRIIEQQRMAKQKALLEIVPKSRHDNEMLDDTIAITDSELLKLDGEEFIYRARQNGVVEAVIIPAVAPDGYAGDIKMIVGVNKDGSLAGVRVIEHHETPGLGDKVELKKSPWILDFAGKSLTDPNPNQWKVKKDKGQFDQFTGATITPRAVVNSVYRTLTFFENHKQQLLAPGASKQASTAPETAPKTKG